MMASLNVVNTTTLTNPNGAASDFCLYSLDQLGTLLVAGGWLNGSPASPANPDGVGLDRIYVSSSPTLDNFAQATWTSGQSPGTWNDGAGQDTLYNEVVSNGTYSLQPYYGPGQTLSGSLYYIVNDPSVVDEHGILSMFVSAVPCQNEYLEANGPGQLGYTTIGLALSADGGATWTWEGALPLEENGAPILAPVLQPFPTDPTASYNLLTAGNGSPSALNVGADAYLYYTHREDGGSLPLEGTPSVWLSIEHSPTDWATPQQCGLVTASGTLPLLVVQQDVAMASDGSGTLWMIAQQWKESGDSGDIKLFYSSLADGAEYGVNWHTWDGGDGVLVPTTHADWADGQFNLISPQIVSVGNGTVEFDYSVPTVLGATVSVPQDFNQLSETVTLQGTTVPCFCTGTRVLTLRGEVPVEALSVGDLLPTLSGGRLVRVRWLGHSDAAEVAPIHVRAHAFGDGAPLRDLWLSPDHAICTGDVLIPVRCLLNDATVVQEAAPHAGYWHLELDAHGVVLADGLPCESYLDTGNRAALGIPGRRNRLRSV